MFFIDTIKNYSNIDDAFFESENFKYDVYFNNESLNDLISDNKEPRLSFIAYNSQKLFKSRQVSELNDLENCIKQTFLTANILSASSLHPLPKRNNLINIVFPQQEVINYFFIEKNLY